MKFTIPVASGRPWMGLEEQGGKGKSKGGPRRGKPGGRGQGRSAPDSDFGPDLDVAVFDKPTGGKPRRGKGQGVKAHRSGDSKPQGRFSDDARVETSDKPKSKRVWKSDGKPSGKPKGHSGGGRDDKPRGSKPQGKPGGKFRGKPSGKRIGQGGSEPPRRRSR